MARSEGSRSATGVIGVRAEEFAARSISEYFGTPEIAFSQNTKLEKSRWNVRGKLVVAWLQTRPITTSNIPTF